MIRRPSPRRALLAVALAVLSATALVPAAAPLAGPAGPASRVRAAQPGAPDPHPTVIWHGPRTDRVVALTFDDGWNPRTLRAIHRILVRERVPATFFVTGVYVSRAPALWRRIATTGFPLANHSYLHRDSRDLGPRVVARDLAMTRRAVERATGQVMLPYYRPPYGVRNAATDRLAAEAGFPYVVLWDTTGADTGPRPTVASVVRDATVGKPGSIVLLHAGPAVTPRALPAIIARYRARGFEFVTLPDLLGLPHPNPPVDAVPLAASDLWRPRSMDRPGDESGRARRAEPASPGAGGPALVEGGLLGVPPGDDGTPPLALAPSISVPERPPPAREAAWARRDGTPASVAVFTAALLTLIVAAAAVAGRSRRSRDEAGR